MCPMERVQKALSGKWKLEIIFRIMIEEQGFNELNRKIHWISEPTLNRNLKALIEDDIVQKEILSVMPIRVKYKLTSNGEKLRPIFLDLLNWVESSYNINIDKKLIEDLKHLS